MVKKTLILPHFMRFCGYLNPYSPVIAAEFRHVFFHSRHPPNV
jgi:hypothetical protein